MKIVILEPLSISAESLEALTAPLRARGHTVEAYDTVAPTAEEMTARAGDADVLVIANHPLPGEVIQAAPNLKYISVAFVGVDHVDLAACSAREIHISNAGGYCDDAVAELALGLAIGILRELPACHASVQSGGGKLPSRGHELAGRTVGIVGTGAIGCRTAELFRAFGCKLVGYSRHQSARGKELGIEYLPLDELMARADIVSIHTPLTPETTGMIGAKEIGLMKQGAMLLNTSRGPVVDTAALAEALNSGRIFAGIDVYESDPPLAQDHPLMGAKNLICTPHIGFDTVESIQRRAEMVFENIFEWMNGNLIRRML